jgi:hypothetical protein|tara:strand:+ start:2976 stop:3665 length:690 start_codon:yes stop_codon:yes gene_type:complete
MKINFNKWIKTLTFAKAADEDNYNSNSEKWIYTPPIEKKNNSIKNYSVVAILFVCGLMFVSVIKNETRQYQKKIDIFQKSINNIKVELHQETLDNEIITAPENLVLLAKENLESNFIFYKKSQINGLDNEKSYIKISNKNLTPDIRQNIVKKIKEKKDELTKLKKIYSNPKEIPNEIKTSLAQKIEKKKQEISHLYKNPKESLNSGKAQKWILLQVAKIFVGIPVVPGK